MGAGVAGDKPRKLSPIKQDSADVVRVEGGGQVISNVAQTSREAISSISMRQRHTQNDDVLLVVTLACRAGAADMTGQEIMVAYRARFDRDMYPNVISRVVGSLVDGRRLVRMKESRACTVSGKQAYPVTVVAKQERMFY